MRRPVWPAALRSSISVRLFAILCVSVLGIFFTYASVLSRYRDEVTRNLLHEEAFRTSSYIKQTLVAEMMDKERDHIRRAIRQLGGEPGMERIRIYNDRGEIRFSSDEREVGRQLRREAAACSGCHERDVPPAELPDAQRTRVYAESDGSRVLGIVNPIVNDLACSAAGCHDPEQSVLGVLDVQLSLAGIDSVLSRASQRSAWIAAGIVTLATFLIAAIVYNSVHVPASRLRRGTQALARGDLDVTIDVSRGDELGQLARSFNEMAASLKRADAELRDWSVTLERRVAEKTEELEAINQQMLQVEKAASLGKMAATVAHELNNPLSGIVTYTRVIQRKAQREIPAGREKDQILDDLELIRAEGMRCGRIVKDLLTYARETPRKFTDTGLHELIRRVVKLAEHHMEMGAVRVELDLAAGDDRLRCDPDQIVQALLALAINAAEAMPEGGVLRLETADGADPTQLYLRVADTGAGIPESALGRIFDPFFSTKPESKGVGLGLAVVYGIVRRHDGSIRVETAAGRGTSFHIELPRDPPGPTPAASGEPAFSEWLS